MNYLNDIFSHAVGRLACQFGSGTNMQKVVQVFSYGLQKLTDDIYGLAQAIPVEVATGAVLDRWAEYIGLKRGSLTDAELRERIKGRALADVSNGRTDDLIAVLQALAVGATDIYVNQSGQATITIGYVVPTPESTSFRELLSELLHDAKSAGVRIEWIVEAGPNYFGFAEDPNALGFDNGELAEAI